MVLIIERGITPKERLRQQDIYAERMSTGEKALTLKQTMSVCDNLTFEKIVWYYKCFSILFKIFLSNLIQPEQLEEIKDIIEMKVSHRKNINRRKEKFGYESNSLIGMNMTGM